MIHQILDVQGIKVSTEKGDNEIERPKNVQEASASDTFRKKTQPIRKSMYYTFYPNDPGGLSSQS